MTSAIETQRATSIRSFIHSCAKVGSIAISKADMDPALGEQI